MDSAHQRLIASLSKENFEISEVVFGKELDKMTQASVDLVRKQKIFIHPDFQSLISQLLSIQYNSSGHPDKSNLSFDLVDCFLMLCSSFWESDDIVIRVGARQFNSISNYDPDKKEINWVVAKENWDL